MSKNSEQVVFNGKRLMEIRNHRRLSQPNLAKTLGIQVNAISKYENQEQNPNPTVFVKLIFYLNVSGDWLVNLSDDAFSFIKPPFEYPPTALAKDRLFAARMKKDLSIEQASELLNIAETSYTTYERANALPRLDIMYNISQLMSISIDYLLGFI